MATSGRGNDNAVSSSMLQFDLQATKAQVIKELNTILPNSIKKFMHQPTFDKISRTCLLFFICTFQRKLIQQALDKARKQRLEGYDLAAVGLKIAELERDAESLKAELSPLYSMILLRHSSYQHVNRDRLFFEGLYIVIINICDDALAALEIRHDIEILLGKLFRGRYFNLYDRMNSTPRSVDTLSLKELYAIKHETTNRALNSKLLSSLNARVQALNISGSSVNNSPLIYDSISSVITARALIKDPEFRKERMGVKNEDANGASLDAKGTGGSQSLTAEDAGLAAATAPGRLQGGNSNIAGKVPAPEAMAATALNVADAPAMDTLASTAPTTVAAIAADGTKRFVGPGYESFGILYDDTLSDLEDLKAYLHTGRHPKLDMRKLRTRASRVESGNLSQKPSNTGSLAASSLAGSGNGELF